LKETYSRQALGTGSKRYPKSQSKAQTPNGQERTNQKFRAKLRHPMYKKEKTKFTQDNEL
jgi:hypothetical protein